VQRTIDERRQQAVESLAILDSPVDPRFDALTQLARSLFGVAYSTVTIIDDDRAWFASCGGLPIDEMPRRQTFCDTTVRLARPLHVADARADPDFADLPGVTGPLGIRFYAGYPLVDPTGIAIGSFCLYGTEPRVLDPHEDDLFRQLAAMAQRDLLAHADLDRARSVQHGLLPRRRPHLPGYAIAGTCEPAVGVGGDYFDLAGLDDGLLFTLADVMGKGLGPAIIAATVRAVMRSTSRAMSTSAAAFSLAEMLEIVRQTLQADLDDTESFVTLFHARLDAATGRVRYADAGHGLTLVVHADGSSDRLVTSDLPLGVDAGATVGERVLDLEPGDTLLCFSDGLHDMLGSDQAAWDEITQLVRVHPEPDDLVAQVRSLAQLGSPSDDVTAVALRRLPLT